MSPHLCYRTFQELCSDVLTSDISLQLAYCPVQLAYPLRRRRIHTGKFLESFKREAPERVRDAFETGVRQWEASPECRQFRDILDAALPPRVTVSSIVAFACSTMTIGTGQAFTIAQHAMVLTVLDVLQTRGKMETSRQQQIRCFAQDPYYNDTDEEILGQAGITVLEDPRGFLHVDDQSVVLSFAPNAPIRQIVADIARPAILIWDRVTGDAEGAEYR
jgi:hypothetical protein